MIRIKSNNHPGDQSTFKVFQDYSWDLYLWLFGILMMILFYQLANGFSILFTGIVGVFGVVIFTNLLAMVRMRRKIIEIGFYRQQFYLKSVFDEIFHKKPGYFPLPYANAKLHDQQISVTYFDGIVSLQMEEWENEWEDVLYYFGFRYFQ